VSVGFNDETEKKAKEAEHDMRSEYVAPEEKDQKPSQEDQKSKGRKGSVIMMDPDQMKDLIAQGENVNSDSKSEDADIVAPLAQNENPEPKPANRTFARAPTITVVNATFNDAKEQEEMTAQDEMRTEYEDLLKRNQEEANANAQGPNGNPRRQSLVLAPQGAEPKLEEPQVQDGQPLTSDPRSDLNHITFGTTDPNTGTETVGNNDIWQHNSKEAEMVNALEEEVKRLMAEADLWRFRFRFWRRIEKG